MFCDGDVVPRYQENSQGRDVAEDLFAAALSYPASKLRIMTQNKKQECVVSGILKRKDVLVNSPTGFSKSASSKAFHLSWTTVFLLKIRQKKINSNFASPKN